jgi:hypothetical protein
MEGERDVHTCDLSSLPADQTGVTLRNLAADTDGGVRRGTAKCRVSGNSRSHKNSVSVPVKSLALGRAIC